MSVSDIVQPWCRVGHVTDLHNRTGCTVLLFDHLAPTVVDVRGGAPGTRETDVLASGRLGGRADAIVLTGGSAFGLAAADGVMRYLKEQDRGFQTAAGGVPIVPAAVIFDLTNGTATHPTSDDGYRAAASATGFGSMAGRVGAGSGATVAKLAGVPTPAGMGIATVTIGDTSVTAVVVLNAVGDVVDPTTGSGLARSNDLNGVEHEGRRLAMAMSGLEPNVREGENTTIGVILISQPVSRDALQRCCISAHDGLARCVIPAHTIFDGDTFFAAAPGDVTSDAKTVLQLATASEVAVERAILSIFQK